MAAILNSAILDSAILLKFDFTLLSSDLDFTQKQPSSEFWPSWIQTNSDSLTWWWQTILNSSIFNSAIMDSAILHKTLTQTSLNLTQTHSFWLNLMMAAILNSAILVSDTAILDSDTLLSSLRFTQKHSHSILALTQTNSAIWLKLIHSHLTWWWQPSWILPSWIQILPSWIQTPCYLLSDSLKNTLPLLWPWLKLIQSV